MLFVYNKKIRALEPCQATSMKAQNLLERQDLEKWIEEQPEILGEDLLIVTTEYDKFDKTSERLDLLGLDRGGNLVVVELKRDDSGKSVDLQALKYAAYCSTLGLEDVVGLYHSRQSKRGATVTLEQAREVILGFIEDEEFEEINEKPRIILVSREFRPEVTASVMWLRKFGVDLTCVKLTPYELKDGNLAIDSSILIPLPEAKEFMMQSEKKESVEYGRTVSQTEYIAFYSELISRMPQELGRHYGPPYGKSYYQITTGISGVHFEWAFHGRPRSSFGVELHFEKGRKDLNSSMFLQVKTLQDRIEPALHEKVQFQIDWGNAWSRIYVERQEGKVTDELKQWAVEKMVPFIRLVQPELEKIKEA